MLAGTGAAGLAGAAAALSNNTALCFDGAGHMSLAQIGAPGTKPTFLISGVAVPDVPTLNVVVTQSPVGGVTVGVNGKKDVISTTLPAVSDVGGALAVHAVRGGTVHVTELTVTALVMIHVHLSHQPTLTHGIRMTTRTKKTRALTIATATTVTTATITTVPLICCSSSRLLRCPFARQRDARTVNPPRAQNRPEQMWMWLSAADGVSGAGTA